MILNDQQIDALCFREEHDEVQYPGWKPMITPYTPRQVRFLDSTMPDLTRCVSFGLSSFGYDLRVGRRFKTFTPAWGATIDPKNFDEKAFVEIEVEKDGDFVIIPAGGFALAASVEWFNIPDDVLTLCVGKSTYARCGIIVNVTPFEPGWCGRPTLEISNTTPNHCRVYAGEGLAQVIFFRGQRPAVSYGDRKGKYQAQDGVIGPRV